MNRLNPIEQECQGVLTVIQDMITPGHPLGNKSHTEIAAMVRDALVKLQNKEFGCSTGRHAGRCSCKDGVLGHSLPGH